MVQPVKRTHHPQAENSVIQAFADMDDSLLILGNPGSGKTTMLLELAQDLHAKAAASDSAPIPVVVDLARWAARSPGLATQRVEIGEGAAPTDTGKSTSTGQPRRVTFSRREARKFGIETGQAHNFHDWLLKELNYLYSIPRNVAELWLRDRKLTLLLDGLDEVRIGIRDQCVEAINKFQDEYKVPAMAITSRRRDYDKLKGRLILQGSVQIQPLTQSQISMFLDTAGDRLRGVREALERDDTLWQLLDSPLMLNVMVLAYHDRSASEVILGATLGDRRKRLITAYVDEVVTRRRAPAARYKLGEIQRWLAQLAYCARVHQSYMPLHRSVIGWRMPWHSTAPESRVRFAFSAFFPWAVGISCCIGAVVPLSLRLGAVVTFIPVTLLLTIQVSYVVFTIPIRRKKHARSLAYPRLRRNGIIVGAILGAAGYLLFALSYNHEIALGPVIRVLVVVGPLILLLALAGRLEVLMRGAYIDTLWWSAIIVGAFSSYLLYRWHPSAQYLTFAFSVAFVTTLTPAALVLMAYFAISKNDYFRSIPRRVDWSSIIVPVVLTAMAMVATLFVHGPQSAPLFVPIIGVAFGALWAVAAALLLVVIGGTFVSPVKIVLAGLDLLPFRLAKFLDYAVDRNLLYREKRGSAFIHAIFQDYFNDAYRGLERRWAATAYKDSHVPDGLPPAETLDEV